MNKRQFFVDTSALIAILNPRDRHHTEVRQYLEAAGQPAPQMVVTNLVLAELATFFSRHDRVNKALKFLERLLDDPMVKIVWIDAPLHREAGRLLEKFSDKRLSFTDAASFALMRRDGLTHALAFDEDFTRAGFQVLP
jgi:predicted nucleic acid-binding protein